LPSRSGLADQFVELLDDFAHPRAQLFVPVRGRLPGRKRALYPLQSAIGSF
jgi:hypothetical protein